MTSPLLIAYAVIITSLFTMAKAKVTKSTKTKVVAKAKKAPVAKVHNPHESPIIQAGVIFIIVSAIGITAFVFANYYR